MIRSVYAAAGALLCFATAHAATQPIENFARRPQMQGVTISADGRYIAFLSGAGDDTVLMTFDRTQAGSAFKRVTSSEPDKFDIGWCRWASDNRVLCGVFGNIRGKKYAEPPYKRLFAVNGDGSALKLLEKPRDEANGLQAKTSMRNLNMNYGAHIEHSNKSEYATEANQESMGAAVASNYRAAFRPDRQDEVIDFTPDAADTVLIQTDDNLDGYPAVVLLNILTGARAEKIPESLTIQVYVTDGRGNARLGWGTTRGGETSYFARLAGDDDWKRLVATKGASAGESLRPFAIGVDPNTAYAFGASEGRDALWSIDLTDKRPPQVLFTHPIVDVGEPVFSRDRRLIGVHYDVERPYAWYANPKHRELIDRLERQFPNRVHEIIDSSDDQKVLVIRSSSDVDEGTYYLYDLDNQKLQKLGVAYPELDPKSLGTMTHIVYKAADGTEIPGYLTIPSGAEKRNLPLIVMPHDGPAERDSWRFSYLRTFLANRGYAVLQPNYRGSAGLGEKWRVEANQDWGGLVNADIQDATRWAVSEGIADPKRVCILGWGFGGYQALLSASRNGGRYRCAVSIAGIADIDRQRSQGTALGKTIARNEFGKDSAKADRDSPVASAANVDIPVLLIHGTKDWQVQIDQSHEMENALSKHDKDVKLVTIKNGSHDLERRSDRLTLLREIEAFLAQHLAPAAPN